MKRIIKFTATLFAAALLSLQAFAQTEPVVVKVWPDGAPNTNESTGNDAGFEPTLTIFKAQNPNGLALLALPGGGYAMLSKTHEALDFNKFYNSIGVTYAVLEYRLPHGHKDIPLSDVHQAIRILRGMAEELGFTKLGVQGCSAGGHLASTAATHYDEATRPDFQILFYPVITMDKSITHISSHDLLLGEDASEEDEILFSSEKQVTADTPPALILHSSDDGLVPVENSIRYYQALVASKVSASIHIYPVGNHGWGSGPWFLYHDQCMAEIEKWLNDEILNPRPKGPFPFDR